jgi:hypothetical protein
MIQPWTMVDDKSRNTRVNTALSYEHIYDICDINEEYADIKQQYLHIH